MQKKTAFQLRQRLPSPPPQVSGALWVVPPICGSVGGFHRKITNRLDRDLQEEIYYGNWPKQWWRLRSSTVCPLQAGESQKPIQHSLSLTAWGHCGGDIISNSPKVRESGTQMPKDRRRWTSQLKKREREFSLSPLFCSIWALNGFGWYSPTLLRMDLLYWFNSSEANLL